jgi:hypothetical protein
MERRKSLRHQCRLPLQIVRIGHRSASRLEQTINFSQNGGICFQSPDPLEVGQPVEYEITVSSLQPPVVLRCEGLVVRCIPAPGTDNADLEIAITMQRYRFAAITPVARHAAAAF